MLLGILRRSEKLKIWVQKLYSSIDDIDSDTLRIMIEELEYTIQIIEAAIIDAKEHAKFMEIQRYNDDWIRTKSQRGTYHVPRKNW